MFDSILMRWTKLEPIMQSEVSQKEKHQYSILTHIYGIQKDSNNNLYARQQKRHRCKEQTFRPHGRRRGWDDLREQHLNMYITMCEINDQCNLMHEARCSKPALWDNSEGWNWEGGGRGIQAGETHMHPWLIHVDVWQKPPQYCKKIIL